MDPSMRFCFRTETPDPPAGFLAQNVYYSSNQPYASIELPATFFANQTDPTEDEEK